MVSAEWDRIPFVVALQNALRDETIHCIRLAGDKSYRLDVATCCPREYALSINRRLAIDVVGRDVGSRATLKVKRALLPHVKQPIGAPFDPLNNNSLKSVITIFGINASRRSNTALCLFLVGILVVSLMCSLPFLLR